MKDKIAKALGFVSDSHVAEAAACKKSRRPLWIAAVAAVLAVVLLVNGSGLSLALRAQAVSVAEYPDYEQHYYREEMDAAKGKLTDFFRESIRLTLSGKEENQTYSPLNLYMAMSVAAELTAGQTRQQILDIMNADSMEDLRRQANQVWLASYHDDHNQTLLANSLWLNEDLSYTEAVMDTLAENYYTSVYRTELGSAKANKAIRSWLNDQTKGFLEQEVKNAGVSSEPGTFPVLALYATVFFRAKWSESVEFHESMNTQGVFHATDGDRTVTYMNKKEMQTAYYWGDSFGAVSLGMKDGSRMWLILPDEDKTVDAVLESGQYMALISDPDGYRGNDENGKYMKVNLSLPKFDIRAGGDLKEALQAMGVTDLFSGETADFSGSVNGAYPVWITAVNQATRVAIDEEGVTAASYIEIPGAGAAMPPEEIIDFILDRPFIFVITNRYDLPLFAGVVNQP